jgi:hypothetical protein
MTNDGGTARPTGRNRMETQAMPLWRKPWATGAAAGLALGLVILVVGFSRVAESTVGAGPLEYLAAVPPFISSAFRGLPNPALLVLFAVWWSALGALLGHCLSKGRRGQAVAAALAVVVAAGHVHALKAIRADLNAALEPFGLPFTGGNRPGK